jgi:two-component system, chemotaxis family, chemotaxis protein CheY
MANKILVVDDSPQIRRLVRSAIENRTDWIVYEAEHGKIAVLMVGTHRPHLVILDLSMPVMNGLDAAREISRTCPGMPMIIFTLHVHDAIHELAHGVGIKHVFSKWDGMGDHVFEAMIGLLPPSESQVRAS